MSYLSTPPSSQPQPLLAGRNAQVFQPPQSPFSAVSGASLATPAGDYFSSGSRKRSRPDSSHNGGTTNDLDWQTPVWAQREGRLAGDEGFHSVLSSDSMMINERYNLRGGFDTPGLVVNADLDSFSDRDVDSRRRLRDAEISGRGSGVALSGPLARERNGVARKPVLSSPDTNSAGATTSWTRFAFTLPFSIAGKVFSLGTTVLHGFYAGGGKGYDMGSSHPRTQLPPFLNRWQPPSPGRSTPLPGSWYDSPPPLGQSTPGNDDFLGDFEQDNPIPSLRPPNKRRQTDRDTWVLVGTPDIEATTPASPKRKTSSTSIPRVSRPGGSRTSSRRAIRIPSRRQSYNTSTGSPAAYAPSPQQNDRRAVFASPRQSLPVRAASPQRPDSSGPAGYVSPEAERFVRRQAKQERAADKAMNSMSRQLEELIRQGQAALGTKFSIEDDGGGMEDEGFVDDVW